MAYSEMIPGLITLYGGRDSLRMGKSPTVYRHQRFDLIALFSPTHLGQESKELLITDTQVIFDGRWMQFSNVADFASAIQEFTACYMFFSDDEAIQNTEEYCYSNDSRFLFAV